MYQKVATAGNGALPVGSGDKRKRLELLKLRCLRCLDASKKDPAVRGPSGSAARLLLSVPLRESGGGNEAGCADVGKTVSRSPRPPPGRRSVA